MWLVRLNCQTTKVTGITGQVQLCKPAQFTFPCSHIFCRRRLSPAICAWLHLISTLIRICLVLLRLAVLACSRTACLRVIFVDNVPEVSTAWQSMPQADDASRVSPFVGLCRKVILCNQAPT